MASQDSKAQGHHQGTSQRHRLRMSTGLVGFITVWEAAWTTNTNISSDSIVDHHGLSRKFNPESEPLLILDVHPCQELHFHLRKLQAVVTITSILLDNDNM